MAGFCTSLGPDSVAHLSIDSDREAPDPVLDSSGQAVKGIKNTEAMKAPENKDTEYPAGGNVELAHGAARGDQEARTRVSEIAHPIITFQTSRFCKRFCNDNRYRYHCTLAGPQGAAPGTAATDAHYCEWGNASYGWMLDDLTRPERLQRFQGNNGASLGDYLYHIANSLPFYERWKDWRFGRKVHVPTYIREMDSDADRVFYALRAGDTVPLIAQKTGRNESEIDELAQRILVELTRRKRLHLLNPPSTVSLSGSGEDEDDTAMVQADVASFDTAPEVHEQNAQLRAAWEQLDAVEQFVLEATLIEDQDANEVLAALKKLDIRIAEGVPAADTDRQQLYYFRRKTLAKLGKLAGLSI